MQNKIKEIYLNTQALKFFLSLAGIYGFIWMALYFSLSGMGN